MSSIRTIFLTLMVSGMFLVFTTSSNPNASGFETAGGAGAAYPWLHTIIIGDHLGLPIHQDLTKDGLDFFNDDTKTLLADEHLFMEANQTSINHFDNCAFSGTIAGINQKYDLAVSKLHPGATKQEIYEAAEQFGRLLHPVQDFYAHSNWVEMGRRDLVDSGYSYWTQIKPFSLTTGDHPVFSFEVEKNTDTRSLVYATQYANKVIRVKTDSNTYQDIGLVSGTYGDPKENHCLPGASIPHGSSIRPYYTFTGNESVNIPDELNKDNPKRKGFAVARELALQQTTHEFCRLVSLTNTEWGQDGVKVIYDNWIQNKAKASSLCPIHYTQTGLINDSSTYNEVKISAIPSWIKNNARYWSDGSLTDKEFVTGIGYLVKEKILSSNVKTDQNGEIVINENLKIPAWIKNNARYWSEDSISDIDFISGIDYMITQNIISFSEPVQNSVAISTPRTPHVGTPSALQPTPLSEIPLGFSVPSQITQEATSSAGTIVSFTTPFSSPPGSTQSITCTPTSGSQFQLGNTIVKCIETDSSNQKTLEKSFTVSIRDTTGPSISPFNPHNDTPDDSGAIVYFTEEAIDLVDGQVTVHCDHESGTKFPLGTTIVTCTADDSKANHSERKLGITITKS